MERQNRLRRKGEVRSGKMSAVQGAGGETMLKAGRHGQTMLSYDYTFVCLEGGTGGKDHSLGAKKEDLGDLME